MILLLSLLLHTSPSWSQAPDFGYVVKVDPAGIYLDAGEKSGAQPGQPFVVYEEGEELRHPVTGKSLGPIEITVAQGTIREVHQQYSLGAITGPSSDGVKGGQRFRLLPVPPAPAPAPPPAYPAPAGGRTDPNGIPTGAARSPRWKSGLFDFEIYGMAVADFDGDSRLDTAIADDKRVYLYAYPPDPAAVRARHEQRGTTSKILSIEAADLNANGRAELFVTRHNQGMSRVETVVLEVSPEGRWTEIGELPWIVRGYQGADGRRELAVQQLLDNRNYPFSSIYPLSLAAGKYGPGGQRLAYRRIDWIYDFTTADLDGQGAMPLYYTGSDRLRIDMPKGSWKSPDAYGQTPVRFRWVDKPLQCHPSVAIRYQDRKLSGIYVVKNLAKFGGLAQPFGLYGHGELHRKDWDGLALETTWKGDLSGYSTALAMVERPQTPTELAVAVVGTTGKSSLWVFDP